MPWKACLQTSHWIERAAWGAGSAGRAVVVVVAEGWLAGLAEVECTGSLGTLVAVPAPSGCGSSRIITCVP